MTPRRSGPSAWWPLLAALLPIVGLLTFGVRYREGFFFDVGFSQAPGTSYSYFVAFFALFSLLAVVPLTMAFVRMLSNDALFEPMRRTWNAIPDRVWMAALACLAIALAAGIRLWSLHDHPLSDGENALAFMARVFASGRAWLPSHSLAAFFDRPGLFNDQRMFATAPIGWPLLLAPMTLAKVGGFANALYFGASVPLVFLVLRRLVQRNWAVLGTALYVTSPMLMLAAATALPHTTAVVTMVCFTWCWQRASDEDAPLWVAGTMAASATALWCIQPLAATALVAPLASAWLWSQRRRGGRGARAAGLFIVGSLAGFALWLWSNAATTGSPWVPPQIVLAGATTRTIEDPASVWSSFIAAKLSRDPQVMAASFGVGLFRLNIAAFGWASSFAFMPFAIANTRARPFWGVLVAFAILLLPWKEVGPEAVGPTRWFEAIWPIVVLTTIGGHALTAWTRRIERPERSSDLRLEVMAASGFIAAMLVAFPTYTGYRLESAEALAQAGHMPIELVDEAELTHALLFAQAPYMPKACLARPVTPLVTAPPSGLGDIIWVHERGKVENERLSKRFPKRKAFVFRWLPNCVAEVAPFRGSGDIVQIDLSPLLQPDEDEDDADVFDIWGADD